MKFHDCVLVLGGVGWNSVHRDVNGLLCGILLPPRIRSWTPEQTPPIPTAR